MNDLMKRFFALLLAIAALLPCLCTAVLADDDALFYVDDGADVISEEDSAYIAEKNKALFALTGAEIVIVTSDSMSGASMAEYAMELFNAKKIGDKEKNNGILLVMTTGKVKNYYMLPGSGLEKKLTSDYMKNVLNTVLEPKFKDGDYSGGARAVFDALITKLESIYSVDIDQWDGQPGAYVRGGIAGALRGGFGFGDFLGIVFIIVIIALIFLLLFARPISVYLSQRKNRYKSVHPMKRSASGAIRQSNAARRSPSDQRGQRRRPSDARSSDRGRGAQIGSDGFIYPDEVTPPIRRAMPQRTAEQSRQSRQAAASTHTSGSGAPQASRQVTRQASEAEQQRSARRNKIMDNIDDEL